MKFHSSCLCLAAAALPLTSTTAFITTAPSPKAAASLLTASSFIPRQQKHSASSSARYVGLIDSSDEEVEFNPQGMVPLNKDTMITPEGYGFTAPAKRIIKEANRANNGFYKASSSDNIMSVIAAITGGSEYDAALVYDGNDAVGLFTESDYIRVGAVDIFVFYS